MTLYQVCCSTPVEDDDGLRSWKDDAPVREVRTARGTTRLIFEGDDRPVVVRR